MTKICLFAGTAEGRRLSEFLRCQDAETTVCVATGYGGSLLRSSEHLRVQSRRLSEEEIRQMFETERFDLVIDATHPFAVKITENIAAACAATGTSYQRLLREGSADGSGTVIVPDIPSAVSFLDTTSGPILLTTGSKDLRQFAALKNFTERIYARVLPLKSSLEACEASGLRPDHIIAMQGPFTAEMNMAMLRAFRAEWLVTKDSGETGGFSAKISAAGEAGAGLVIIGRPPQTKGLSEAEVIRMLCDRFGFKRQPLVKIVGTGPGGRDMMTMEAFRAVISADGLIGAGRLLEIIPEASGKRFEAIAPDAIAEIIRQHAEMTNFAVLMSGDSGFFSGTRRLLPYLRDCRAEVLPGISSLSAFCAKLGISYEEVHTVSLHGRSRDIIPDVRAHGLTFILTGGENTASGICRGLEESGLNTLSVTVGEKLGYPEEKITGGTPAELRERSFDPLSVILIKNEHPDAIVTHGLPDDTFRRDTGEKGLIPMTKSEIRSVCLSKLALTENAVCWDIGSGTGSVAIEMALRARRGSVYAVEKDPAAAALCRENAERLHAENLTCVEGSAPEILTDLPAPTHVFIGGASGSMKEIFRLLSAQKSEIRVTATAVSLETVAELNEILKTFPFAETDVVMVQTAKGKHIGDHTLMTGGNPVCIFSMRISGDPA